MNSIKSNSGYIALISVVIICLLLITITVSLSLSNFMSRVNATDNEAKERSLALAESCIGLARLKLVSNPNYVGNETIVLNNGSCDILLIAPPIGGEKTIKSKAAVNKAFTNLKVVINAIDSSALISWEEVPNF